MRYRKSTIKNKSEQRSHYYSNLNTILTLNFAGKIFVFWLVKKSWGINFHGHCDAVDTIVVEYARY